MKMQLNEYKKVELGLSQVSPAEAPWATVVKKNLMKQQMKVNEGKQMMPPAMAPPPQMIHHQQKGQETRQERQQRQPKQVQKKVGEKRYTMHAKTAYPGSEISIYQQAMRQIARRRNIDWKKEMTERKEKKNNLVILNVLDQNPTKTYVTKEDRTDTTSQEPNDDLVTLREMVDLNEKDPNQILETVRLGATGEFRPTERPIKVTCATSEMKQYLMSEDMVKALKDRFGENVRVQHDKTLLQRMTLRKIYLDYHKNYKQASNTNKSFQKDQ